MDREKRARAGAWLKRAREDRGVSVRKVAAYFDVSTQSVYGWEAGNSDFVDDDRAAGLAKVLRMDLSEVRRGLGLWMPPEGAADVGALTPDEIIQRLKDDPKYREEFVAALLDLRERGVIGGDDESD